MIRSATIEAINSGLNVIGIYEGFEFLSKGDSSHVKELRIEDVSRIHFDGGSILHTSRVNPAKSKEMLDASLKALTQLSVDYLVTIGGDDTATSAHKIDLLAKDRYRLHMSLRQLTMTFLSRETCLLSDFRRHVISDSG